MEKSIRSELYGKRELYSFRYSEVSECPLCHKGIQPVALSSLAFKHNNGILQLYVLNLCPLCDAAFTSVYRSTCPDPQTNQPCYHLITYPQLIFPAQIDPQIKTVSENFEDIYQQAYQAEKEGLDQIAGMGYRRALEFLVKDYCIYRNPESAEKIKSQPLSQCINQYIDFSKLKTVAERAAWLGNDQTHYIQKHTDKDLEDLKRLITLTMHWIIIELGVDEAESIERK